MRIQALCVLGEGEVCVCVCVCVCVFGAYTLVCITAVEKIQYYSLSV